jgi:hypothetical protein
MSLLGEEHRTVMSLLGEEQKALMNDVKKAERRG